MAAKIDVVERLNDAIATHPVSGQVHRYIEMLIKKLAATEEALQRRLSSDRLDMYQKLIVSLAPTCTENSQRHGYGQSVGRMLDLAQHLAAEGTRHTEPEVRNRIEAKYNP